MLDKLLTLLFPRYCVGCRANGSYLCASCQGAIELASDPDLPNTHAVFSYHEPLIRTLIKKLKYKKTKDVAQTVAIIMYNHFLEEIAINNQYFPTSNSQIIVIPIPIHKDRLKERGYNQAKEIAKHIVAQDPQHLKLVDNLLIKTRATNSQVSVKNRAKRLANIKGAFEINSNTSLSKLGLDNSLIILIDDIITTGATMDEAMQTLKKAGAKKIIGLAFAHG